MKPCGHPIATLLPLAPPMILLDAVERYDESRLIATVTITDASLFARTDGVPSHIGLEYMAQACGAFAGAAALDRGLPVRIGFLLGTRNLRLQVPWFPVGQRLAIGVTLLYVDEAMTAFECDIRIDDAVVAAAQLTLYQPDDPIAFIRESVA